MPQLYSFIIHFSLFVGQQPLQLASAQYKNAYNEPFSIEQCKFYVSAIQVIGAHGETQILQENPHLVDAADSASLTLRFTTDIAAIKSISFDIGVDSTASTGGVHTGDLDPMLGMFWTWNTGYIDARLEGQSDSAHAPAHRFTWDVGGYRPGVNATRQVALSLSAASSLPASSPIATEPTRTASSPAPRAISQAPRVLDIRADLLRWFDGPHPIHLSKSPICHQPGPLAMQLADNYATMFSVVLDSQ